MGNILASTNCEVIGRLFNRQLEDWPLFESNYLAVNKGMLGRSINLNRTRFLLQHNPARAVSTAARVDPKSIASRPCFLCAANRPPEQEAADMGDYEVLVNPYPIFPGHFTIASKAHRPQRIVEHLDDFLDIVCALAPYAAFYNGPEAGASAPDHLHFQAIDPKYLRIFSEVEGNRSLMLIAQKGNVELHDFDVTLFRIEGCKAEVADSLQRLFAALPCPAGSPEPRVNLIGKMLADGRVLAYLIPRSKHRPDNYGSDPGQMLVSPGTIDMTGTIILPRREDFDNMTSQRLQNIINQVCFPADILRPILESL